MLQVGTGGRFVALDQRNVVCANAIGLGIERDEQLLPN
jgi:uncharacterized circularly permuted ATP-grasp superfamily protein